MSMVRFCTYCGKQIDEKRLAKSVKVKFCRDECRAADRHERAAIKRAIRRSQGRCEGCGRKMPHEHREGAAARVHKVTQ